MLSLPIKGVSIHHDMNCKEHDKTDIDRTNYALGYTRFLNKYKHNFDEVITLEEKTCFYLYWICKFLINSSSKRIVTYYLPIAIALANRHKLALGHFFLGFVYRTLFLATTQPKESIGGPLWLSNFRLMLIFPN